MSAFWRRADIQTDSIGEREYANDDKRSCIGETTSAGMPSYVELVTCLEMPLLK
jgi:hypothetical protein